MGKVLVAWMRVQDATLRMLYQQPESTHLSQVRLNETRFFILFLSLEVQVTGWSTWLKSQTKSQMGDTVLLDLSTLRALENTIYKTDV